MKPPLRPDDAALADALASRKPSELVSILLEVSRRLSARRRPADVLAQYGRDAFVSPCAVDLRDSVRFDAAALDATPAYEAVLLSPLAPLATCSAVSPTTQDRSVTTSRTTEVVSDPTNVLALESARRLIAGDADPVRLCTLHQVVRPQRFGNAKGFSQHFRMLALAEAGVSRSDHAFEVDAVVRATKAFLDFFDRAEALGCRSRTDARACSSLRRNVASPTASGRRSRNSSGRPRSRRSPSIRATTTACACSSGPMPRTETQEK